MEFSYPLAVSLDGQQKEKVEKVSKTAEALLKGEAQPRTVTVGSVETAQEIVGEEAEPLTACA
ncbi:hypothetical protein KIN20_026432 [Parelaphostrongylus tenuis]|uniref:Uncharacterized protein n=1 Tax=Parelaphostrongylus tenuis TaxID=148309 RepID=A0AAD5WCT3_PARTN|nr:hypothetical protein KIN20_001994 [Parelaphostrongylus tenuis]KAJ1365945.1 hypothetical protein KIN20_026432 [Parelaphostrongylus tenuis]